jgi:hypothetical protein
VNREKTAVQKNIDAHTEAVNRLQGLSQALHSAVDSLTSPAQQMADRARAQAEIQADLAITKAGGTLSDNQVESLKKALSAATQDASGQFATYQDYLHDLYQTRDGIEQLGDLTDDSLSIEKDALETAQAQLQSLDAILSHAQEEIDILKGIDTNGLSLVQAMDGLGTAIAAAHANPIAGATSSISQAYQSALGRAPDANGLEFWQNQAAAGSSISAITDAIGNSAEAQIKKLYKELLGRSVDAGGLDFWMHSGASIDEISEGIKGSSEYKTKVPGFASGGDFAGGWRIVGENGPELEATGPARIFSARQTQSIFNGSAGQQVDITELVEQMKLFYEEAKLLREANSQENYFIAKYCQQIADHMDGAVNGDVPFAVKAIPA